MLSSEMLPNGPTLVTSPRKSCNFLAVRSSVLMGSVGRFQTHHQLLAVAEPGSCCQLFEQLVTSQMLYLHARDRKGL